MAITNLTGTKWAFNNEINFSMTTTTSFYINYISAYNPFFTYDFIKIIPNEKMIVYENNHAPYEGMNDFWDQSPFRLIEIKGGQDVENADLIAFLEENATQLTQIEFFNLTGTKWYFNEKVDLSKLPQGEIFINFNSANTNYIGFVNENPDLQYHQAGEDTMVYEDISYSIGWLNQAYRTIEITDGADVENVDLIIFLNKNAVKLASYDLTNTKWRFNERIDLPFSVRSYAIIFNSNNTEFTKLSLEEGEMAYTSDNSEVYCYSEEDWINQAYRTIEITGGEDVQNSNLLAFLRFFATLIPQNFNETKTALKIYEDLTQAEYEGLEKEPNSFYQVNDVGVYKGTKLIAVNGEYAQKRLNVPTCIISAASFDDFTNHDGRIAEIDCHDSSWDFDTSFYAIIKNKGDRIFYTLINPQIFMWQDEPLFAHSMAMLSDGQACLYCINITNGDEIAIEIYIGRVSIY